MTDVIRMKKGDVFTFSHQLKWSDNTPIDLTVAKLVRMVMVSDMSGEYVVDSEMVVFDAENGVVQRMWLPEEVSVPGMYSLEFVIEFNDGSVITVPSGDMLWLWIMEGI